MKIAYYCYDHPQNPGCGGGGAYRDFKIHERLAAHHHITHFCGHFKNAELQSQQGITVRFLGIGWNYLISRITFALVATLHSLFINADLIVIGYSVFSPVLGFLVRRNRTVIELFHLTGKGPWHKYSVFGLMPILAEKIAIVGGRHFICINNELADTLKIRYHKRSVQTVYTGFDETLLVGQNADNRYILYFGRIDIYMKGIDLLLDAFDAIAAKYPEYRLLLGGRGSQHDKDWLKDRIRRSPFQSRIEFRENVPDGEKHTLYHGAALACMPSRFEGWCIAAIEAAACAKPTIGTRISGLSESIRDGVTGILIEPENVHALATAIERLLDDSALRERLGANGHEWAKNFTWDAIAREQERFYLKVASN